MEKSKPHHDLSQIKKLARQGSIAVVGTAMRDALNLGFELSDIIDVIMSLSRTDFYKSMTAYSNSKNWHDVYRPMTDAGQLYIKLILQDDALVVSFKEK
ncbi:MAG: type II toxin-antitoxin system MqsR family toxin [Deltaproteobacteria bacterium]|jgi:motility quorum-sensing regulator/GCU-specific mRNA interferase toxin|nr:type II toxin-antitoxin system MqsR family toxin [Deltaproteobacteria bacterium]